MLEEITQIITYDSARILDQAEGEYEQGWLTVYKRQRVVKFHDAQAVSTTVVNSARFYCAPYAKFLLLIAATVPGSASTLFVWVEQSDDQVNWYRQDDEDVKGIQLLNGDGSQKMCLSCGCRAPYVRVCAIATAGSWTLTSKLILNS